MREVLAHGIGGREDLPLPEWLVAYAVPMLAAMVVYTMGGLVLFRGN